MAIKKDVWVNPSLEFNLEKEDFTERATIFEKVLWGIHIVLGLLGWVLNVFTISHLIPWLLTPLLIGLATYTKSSERYEELMKSKEPELRSKSEFVKENKVLNELPMLIGKISVKVLVIRLLLDFLITVLSFLIL